MNRIFKNLLHIILIISFLDLNIHCTSATYRLIQHPNDLDLDDNDRDLYILTKDSVGYFYNADHYEFDGKILDGFGILVPDPAIDYNKFKEYPESDRFRLNLDRIEKVYVWDKKQDRGVDTSAIVIPVVAGFILLIVITILIKEMIKKDQSV